MPKVSDSIIRAENVFKIYEMGENKVFALNGVSFDLRKGEYVTIMGPSGSGKTTLLDVLSVLLRPTKGEVFIKGKPISKMQDDELAQIRGKTIGFVFQTFNLIPRYSAKQNVMLPLWFEGIEKSEREKIAETDIILALNIDKNNIPNYIGPSVFAEIAYAIGLNIALEKNIQIYLINDLPDKSPYLEELKLWKSLEWIKIWEDN